MPNYNADLQAKNAELDAILETVNALPEAAKPETAGSEIIKANGKRTFSPPSGGVFSSFTADVQVPIPAVPESQEKTVSITSNGTTTITPDVGKLLSKVIAQVNVAGSENLVFGKKLKSGTFVLTSDTIRYEIPESGNFQENYDIPRIGIVYMQRYNVKGVYVIGSLTVGSDTCTKTYNNGGLASINGSNNLESNGTNFVINTPGYPLKGGITYYWITLV